MKREIKFRAWDKEKRKLWDVVSMSYGHDGKEWGWFVTMGAWRESTIEDQVSSETMKIAAQYESAPSNHILLEYTGLKDKNGKDIYEGNVVKNNRGENHEIAFGNIGYDGSWNGLTGFLFKDYYRELFMELEYVDDPTELEIIGNIYENPELIK